MKLKPTLVKYLNAPEHFARTQDFAEHNMKTTGLININDFKVIQFLAQAVLTLHSSLAP